MGIETRRFSKNSPGKSVTRYTINENLTSSGDAKSSAKVQFKESFPMCITIMERKRIISNDIPGLDVFLRVFVL